MDDSQTDAPYEIARQPDGWRASFCAMASPCEVHVATDSFDIADRTAAAAALEARRIEQKFSRYRDDSIVSRINTGAGEWISLDEETSKLLVYADELFRLSKGKFDVTSGVLRRVWRFDGSDRLPSRRSIDEVRRAIGWDRVGFEGDRIRLETGMEIDLGGIGKEYAVDRAGLAAQRIAPHCLINFGGDLVATGTAVSRYCWRVGIENPDADRRSPANVEIVRGALATSGDAQRYLLKGGRRYSHILDPQTGWPVEDAPRSVTVAAATCTLAGMVATFAMLHGAKAEEFLESEGFEYWCLR